MTGSGLLSVHCRSASTHTVCNACCTPSPLIHWHTPHGLHPSLPADPRPAQAQPPGAADTWPAGSRLLHSSRRSRNTAGGTGEAAPAGPCPGEGGSCCPNTHLTSQDPVAFTVTAALHQQALLLREATHHSRWSGPCKVWLCVTRVPLPLPPPLVFTVWLPNSPLVLSRWGWPPRVVRSWCDCCMCCGPRWRCCCSMGRRRTRWDGRQINYSPHGLHAAECSDVQPASLHACWPWWPAVVACLLAVTAPEGCGRQHTSWASSGS